MKKLVVDTRVAKVKNKKSLENGGKKSGPPRMSTRNGAKAKSAAKNIRESK
jgi:hypothetical protein